MRTSFAMMASNVTPPAKDKGAKVDGAIEAGGVAFLCPGPPRSELCLASLNGSCIYGTHHREVKRLGKGDKEMAKDPRDSRRKNELITGRRIPIDIYKG